MIGGMGLFEELFNPGAKHRHEEADRLALAREDDQGNGGPGPIDFKRGVVVIRVRAEPPAAEEGESGGDPGRQTPAGTEASGQPDATREFEAAATGDTANPVPGAADAAGPPAHPRTGAGELGGDPDGRAGAARPAPATGG